MKRTNSSRRTHRFLASAGLPLVLGLAAIVPHSAAAQGVNLVLGTGDTVVVSGAGTAGTYHGLPVAPPMSDYTSYSDTGSANSSGHFTAVETDSTATFTLGSGGVVTDTNGDYGLYATGSGLISLTGGSINGTASESEYGIYSTGSSPIMVSGGSIAEGDDYAYAIYSTGTSPITLSGGAITSSYLSTCVFANGSGGLILSGAAITGSDYGVDFENGGPITMAAGSVSTLPSTQANHEIGQTALYAYNDGLLTLSGGTVTGGTPPDYFAGVAVEADNTNVVVDGATLTSTGYTGVGLETGGTTAVTMTSGAVMGGDDSYGLFDFAGGGVVAISGGTVSAGQDSDAVLDHAGTVTISGTAQISGGAGTDGVYAEIGGALTVTGGTIAGGSNGAGIVADDTSTVTVSGGTVSGGDANSYGNAVDTKGSGTVTLSGGQFTGGSGDAVVNAEGSGQVNISSGTFTARGTTGQVIISQGTGTVTVSGGTFSAPGQYGYDIYSISGAVNVSGGTFTAGPAGYGIYSVGNVNVSGGSISVGAGGAAVRALNGANILISGGSLSGGAATAGGFYDDVVQTEYGTVTVTGGSLTAGAGGDVFFDDGGKIYISGGKITGDPSVTGMTSYDTIDLFGTGWTYTPTGGVMTAIASGTLPGGTGALAGTLLDGSAFDLSYNNQATIEVNVGPAPAAEPSTLAALGIGILGLSALRLKFRKRRLA